MNSADQLAWTAQYFKRLEQQLERINSIQDIQDIHGKMIEVLPKNGVEPNPLTAAQFRGDTDEHDMSILRELVVVEIGLDAKPRTSWESETQIRVAEGLWVNGRTVLLLTCGIQNESAPYKVSVKEASFDAGNTFSAIDKPRSMCEGISRSRQGMHGLISLSTSLEHNSQSVVDVVNKDLTLLNFPGRIQADDKVDETNGDSFWRGLLGSAASWLGNVFYENEYSPVLLARKTQATGIIRILLMKRGRQ